MEALACCGKQHASTPITTLGWLPVSTSRCVLNLSTESHLLPTQVTLGNEKILIANTAGPMSLPGLNGITIEMEWCGNDVDACLDAIYSSRAVAEQAPVDVFWLTQAKQVPPPVQCKLMYEMVSRFNDSTVYAGTVRVFRQKSALEDAVGFHACSSSEQACDQCHSSHIIAGVHSSYRFAL
jgi:hypothetical protein